MHTSHGLQSVSLSGLLLTACLFACSVEVRKVRDDAVGSSETSPTSIDVRSKYIKLVIAGSKKSTQSYNMLSKACCVDVLVQYGLNRNEKDYKRKFKLDACLAMPNYLMAARWVCQYSGPIFRGL